MDEVKETPQKSEANPLKVKELDFHKLPSSFEVDVRTLDGIELLRTYTRERGIEARGVLSINGANELSVRSNGEGNKHIANFEVGVINEENVQDYLESFMKTETQGKNPTEKKWDDLTRPFEIYFVDPKIAEKYMHFLKSLAERGIEIVIGEKPGARLHTHPQGNLPSRGDFGSSLISLDQEIVITDGWTYFLFPTDQTPKADTDTIKQFSNYISMENEEDGLVEYVKAMPRTNNRFPSHPNPELNAVRQKWLQDNCAKYNVGYYTLERGKTSAVRIV